MRQQEMTRSKSTHRQTLQNIGIIYNHRIEEAVSLCRQLQDVLQQMGRDVWACKARELDECAPDLPQRDLIVTLGGDGTILRAARLVAPQHALVLGVNLGQLGFLAELGPGDAVAQIGAVVDGGGWIEERMMLRGAIGDGKLTPAVIDGGNEVVVSRGARPRAIRINVTVDGQHLQTYVADGVIVSTPTGSTAYTLANDGAIIHPELRTLQISPIAPHLTVVRSIVVPASATVGMTIESPDPAVASVDGQIDTPVDGSSSIVVTASPHTVRFVRLQPRGYFCQTLVNRLSTSIVRGLV
jgi:NAD+ kinase